MKNLGKILTLFFIAIQTIHAGAIASVSSSNVEYGEVVTYNLTLSGEDVKKPEIYTLCGEDVVATGSATSIQIVNGNYEKSYVLSYKFVPKKSCTIEPISLEIAGEVKKTKAIDIVVSKYVASKNDDFSLTLSSNKSEVYVGEGFDLTLLFRQKKSAQVVDNKFEQPEFKGFWLKGEAKQEIIKEKEFINTKITYSLAPQREGNLYISPAKIAIASRKNTKNYYGGFFPEVKWRNYFSNDLNITAKALPSGVELVGNFTLEAFADKTEINANEAVNVTIKVVGSGNLEDITSFKPYINGVSIFDEKIEIKDTTLSQKITFVGDSSFSVPTFSLKVFNPQTGEITTISTQAIDIKVNNPISKPTEELNIQREDAGVKPSVEEVVVGKKLDTISMFGILILGVVLGILIMILKPFISLKSKKSFNLKDHKMLLVKLLPYKENEDVQVIVDILESNLYSNEKEVVDKKVLKEIIKKYEIS